MLLQARETILFKLIHLTTELIWKSVDVKSPLNLQIYHVFIIIHESGQESKTKS